MHNLKIPPDMVFMAADGDGIGKKVGRAVIANDFDKLHEISGRIDAAQDFILHWAKDVGGIKISGGGDEFTAAIPKEAIEDVESLRKDIEHTFGYTISVGMGKSLSEAGTALLVAKLRGKDRIVHFNEELKKDIKKAKRRVREKRASQEEYKLSEAYLEKAEGDMANEKPNESEDSDCQYCNDTDGVDPGHCKYCHDAEAKEGMSDCPYCQQEGESQVGSDDCPFCKENTELDGDCPFCQDEASQGPKQPETADLDGHSAEQNTSIQSPDSNNASAPAGSPDEKAQANAMGMNPPSQGKPEIGDNSSPAGVGEANPSNTGAAPGQAAPIIEEGAHSKEMLQSIAQQIEGETADGKTDDKAVADGIDDTEVVGSSMEGNISRPENFNSNQPGDMGLDEAHGGEQNPDLSSVLQEGLEDQADDAQKEKVRGMIGQALQGFKASKQVLEAAKEQAPDFYNASIAMLAAMIHMADMLGLKGPGTPMEGEPTDQSADGEGNEWEEPFPTHPDQGGEAKPGHAAAQGDAAQAPKGDAPIGQPIGKLPTSATTKHVARTPIPVGGVNPKGQKKVMDPKTGKIRFIDMKQGRVMGGSGVPVKPEKRGD